MNRISTGIFAIVLIGGLASCHLWRRSARKREIVPIADTTGVVRADSLKRDSALIAGNIPGQDSVLNAEKKALIDGLMPLWNNRITYNTFSGKAKVHYEGKGDKHDFAATIRMEKDKKIWISVVALGLFEAARALITPDTVIVIDRIHKEVRIVPFKDAGKLLPVAVEFSTLQGLIIGDALHASADRPTDATSFGGGISLDVKTDQYEQHLTYNKADSTIRQQQLKINGDKSPQILMQYGDYETVSDRRFAKSRVINIQDSTGQHYIDMQFNKMEFDQSLDFSFSVPDRYTRK